MPVIAGCHPRRDVNRDEATRSDEVGNQVSVLAKIQRERLPAATTVHAGTTGTPEHLVDDFDRGHLRRGQAGIRAAEQKFGHSSNAVRFTRTHGSFLDPGHLPHGPDHISVSQSHALPAKRCRTLPKVCPFSTSGVGFDSLWQTRKVDLGWIWTENLRPFLEVLAVLTEYQFDESDWHAFTAAVDGTDSERGPWFDYPFGSATVAVAREPGAGEMLSVRVENIGDEWHDRLRWTSDIMRNWRLTK